MLTMNDCSLEDFKILASSFIKRKLIVHPYDHSGSMSYIIRRIKAKSFDQINHLRKFKPMADTLINLLSMGSVTAKVYP